MLGSSEPANRRTVPEYDTASQTGSSDKMRLASAQFQKARGEEICESGHKLLGLIKVINRININKMDDRFIEALLYVGGAVGCMSAIYASGLLKTSSKSMSQAEV